MTKLLPEKCKADVNHILIKYHATPLFNAAVQGHVEVVRYLLKLHNADIHLGNSSFANGPTALHNAVLNAAMNKAIANGLKDIVAILLKHGGPVESFDGAFGTGAEKRPFLVAFKTYRAPVELLNEKQWKQRRQEIEDKGRALKLVVDESGIGWMENIQIRRRDERLEGDGKDLMSLADADGDEEEGERQDYGSENVEPSVKRARRLGWFERMGLAPVEESWTPEKPKSYV